MSPPHLLHVFSTFVPAGPETRAVALVNALAGLLRHSIVAIDGRTDAAALLAPDADARVLPSPPRAGSLATVRALRALLARERPDAVLTYNWGAFDAVVAARTRGLRGTIHHEDGFGPDEVHGPKRRRSLARRLVLPGVHAVVVPSRRLEALALGPWGVPAERVHRVPNGVRLERFAAPELGAAGRALRAELGIPAGALVVGTVGHLRPEKNPLRLVGALARLDPALDVHLLLAGDGPERAALEERVAADARLAGRVHLAGHRADPRPAYAAMDVFALSSDTEQMPVSLLEAMAAGRAAVSTDVGDVALVLPAEPTPLLVSTAGPPAAVEKGLAERLALLLRDPERRAAAGAANRARVAAEFTFEVMLARHRELWLDAVRSGTGPDREARRSAGPEG